MFEQVLNKVVPDYKYKQIDVSRFINKVMVNGKKSIAQKIVYQALDIVEKLVQSGALNVIVVDSVAALVPKAELDGDMGDSHMGLQARLMSQALRKLTGSIKKSKKIINILKEKNLLANVVVIIII